MATRNKPVALATVVTTEAVNEERILLRLALRPNQAQPLPPTHRAAAGRAVSEAAGVVGLAALVWLKQTQMEVYAALVDAGSRYAVNRLTTGAKTLDIRRPIRGKSLARWAAAPRLCQLHQVVQAHLRAAWREQPSVPVSPRFGSAGPGQPYGAQQNLGTRKRNARLDARAAAVESVLAALQVPVTQPVARKWVTTLGTPGPVALQILAHIIRKEPRTAKAMLQEARRFVGRTTKFPPVALATLAHFARVLHTQ